MTTMPKSLEGIARSLEALHEAPAIRAALAERDAAAVAERKRLAAELDHLERDMTARIGPLKAKVEAAAAEVLAAEVALHAARAKLEAANSARASASFTFDRDASAIRAALAAGACPEIDDFMSWTLDEFDRTRKSFASFEATEVVNKITGRRRRVVTNNAESVAARVAAIHAARAEADELRLAVDQAAVPARLAELRAGLPPVDGPATPTAAATEAGR